MDIPLNAKELCTRAQPYSWKNKNEQQESLVHCGVSLREKGKRKGSKELFEVLRKRQIRLDPLRLFGA